MCVCVCVQSDSVKALRIFTEESVDVKSLPREVLNHLVNQAPYCVIPYLVSTFVQTGLHDPVIFCFNFFVYFV